MSGITPRPEADVGQVVLRAAERPSYTEVFLTAAAPANSLPSDDAVPLLDRAAQRLAAFGAEPLQIKLYATPEAMPGLLRVWHATAEMNGLPTCPVTPIERPTTDAGTFHGLQVWALAPPDDGPRGLVSTLGTAPDQVRRFQGPGFALLHAANVQAATHTGGVTELNGMFERAQELLTRHGQTYGQVFRTWIYVRDLLVDYADLNRSRGAHHARHGVSPETPPASTGIQGASGSAAAFMDVLALDAQDPTCAEVRPLRQSDRQGTATSYGSSFSRGMALVVEGKRTLFVSGTASIDPAGHSVYLDDPDAQCVATLLAIGGLLEQEGAGLEHIRMATVFCKTPQAAQAWRRVTKLLRIPNLPAVVVQADVCRPELLVEVEAIAFL